ncbi:ester cyclase [Dyadobacter sp. CY323]|uniref:ester cyclase n=1 Tax=Dyadobacter sp. CY323 TaxID=2907302 RepID=UPI001F2A8860|nr:ester cyclase family protein [Dyadobacter sp. CY323]MCE6990082.1 ester cyclase [Dyadobacter sp. CY323]
MNTNKVLSRRYFYQIMNGMNEQVAHEILSEDFVFTLPTHPEPFYGPDGFIGLVKMLHGSFPDFYINPQEMLAGGDWVITRWKGGGTHTGGPLVTVKGDVQASGKHFEIDGMTWHTIKDGKIVESIGHEDTLGLMLQLGVLPSEGAEAEHDLEHNQTLATRYFEEIMSQGRLDVVEEILDPEFAFIIPTQPEPIAGYPAFKGFVSYLRNAFPDIKFTVMRQTAEGNKVASRWNIEGTHLGEFLGAPATGNHVKDYGIDIFTIKNGKIVSVHVNENDFGLMQQLGAIPS